MSLPPSDPAWLRVRALFDAALALPPAQREAHVRASGADAAVQAEVLSLLAYSTGGAAHDSGFLAQPADWPGEAAPDAGARAGQTGLRLGPWTLCELLGSGGMGEVWRAQRADGAYEGEAAVKLLKRGMDSAAVLQRFAQERQALARLDHPHIARLFDAGLSPQGLPYFVMECVRGQPLDQACAGLPLEQRLALFLQLADAVAYAHRHLLVHRDLKPGNVLVNAEGQVKLLDFGIAKALDPLEDPGAPEQTLGGQRPFTPSYASPEQIRGEPVSTATDVYSLGVLLYQLLTGQRPYGRSASTPAEIARAVLDEAPTRPSSLDAMRPDDPWWLATRQRLQGELDNILLKTLQKAPAGRYASVEALAADVRAFLDGRPVSAHPPSRLYLTAKFVRRHRLPVSLAALALLSLIGGLGTAAWQAHEAAQARDTAQAHLKRLQTITREVVLRHGDAITHLPGGLQIKDQLLKDLAAHLEQLAAEARDDPGWLADLAGVYARLAEIEGDDTGASLAQKTAEGRAFAQRAIALAEQVWPQQRGNADFVSWFMQALQVQSLGLRAENKPAEAAAVMEKTLGYLAEAEQAVPPAQRREMRLNRAASLLRLGQFHATQAHASLEKPEQSLAWFAQAETLLDEIAAEAPKELHWHQIRSTLHGARALTLAAYRGADAARADAERAVAERQAAAALEPANTAVIDGLITEAANLGAILLRIPDAPAALQATTLAWGEASKLARENGAGNKWQTESLPRLAAHHGRALVENSRDADALPVIALALDGLAARPGATTNPAVQRLIAQQQTLRARALLGLGQAAPAREAATRALSTLGPLAQGAKPREALIALADAQALMARLEPAAAARWATAARASYLQADALQPLGGDAARRLKALDGP